jgi:hypothetical protein
MIWIVSPPIPTTNPTTNGTSNCNARTGMKRTTRRPRREECRAAGSSPQRAAASPRDAGAGQAHARTCAQRRPRRLTSGAFVDHRVGWWGQVNSAEDAVAGWMEVASGQNGWARRIAQRGGTSSCRVAAGHDRERATFLTAAMPVERVRDSAYLADHRASGWSSDSLTKSLGPVPASTRW